MKLVTFSQPETGPSSRAGVLHCSSVVDPHAVLYSSYGGGDDAARRASAEAPRDMVALLAAGALTSGTLTRALDLADAAAQADDKASVVAHGATVGIDVQVVERNPADRGFVPQPKRWVVEQTLGILSFHRRLVRD